MCGQAGPVGKQSKATPPSIGDTWALADAIAAGVPTARSPLIHPLSAPARLRRILRPPTSGPGLVLSVGRDIGSGDLRIEYLLAETWQGDAQAFADRLADALRVRVRVGAEVCVCLYRGSLAPGREGNAAPVASSRRREPGSVGGISMAVP